MDDRERALLAVYDLRELDRARAEMQEAWERFVIAAMEAEFMGEGGQDGRERSDADQA